MTRELSLLNFLIIRGLRHAKDKHTHTTRIGSSMCSPCRTEDWNVQTNRRARLNYICFSRSLEQTDTFHTISAWRENPELCAYKFCWGFTCNAVDISRTFVWSFTGRAYKTQFRFEPEISYSESLYFARSSADTDDMSKQQENFTFCELVAFLSTHHMSSSREASTWNRIWDGRRARAVFVRLFLNYIFTELAHVRLSDRWAQTPLQELEKVFLIINQEPARNPQSKHREHYAMMTTNCWLCWILFLCRQSAKNFSIFFTLFLALRLVIYFTFSGRAQVVISILLCCWHCCSSSLTRLHCIALCVHRNTENVSTHLQKFPFSCTLMKTRDRLASDSGTDRTTKFAWNCEKFEHVANEKSLDDFRVWNGEKYRSDREWRRVWVARNWDISYFFHTSADHVAKSTTTIGSIRTVQKFAENWMLCWGLGNFFLQRIFISRKIEEKDEKNFSLSLTLSCRTRTRNSWSCDLIYALVSELKLKLRGSRLETWEKSTRFSSKFSQESDNRSLKIDTKCVYNTHES